jgi:alkylhydroperoxidase family enzyme
MKREGTAMAWIETIPDDQWEGVLARDAPGVRDPKTGRVDHILGIHSLNPRAMAAHNAVYSSAMTGTKSLRKVDRELIAFVVSQINDCHY